MYRERLISHEGHLSVLYLLFIRTLLVNGQTMQPHVLCKDVRVDVVPGRWGTVMYDNADSSVLPCGLSLYGFANDKHISLPGLDLSHPPGNCLTYPKVIVNDLVYCVKDDRSTNQVVIQPVDGKVVVRVNSINSKSFSFNYYSNVAACGELIELVSNGIEQLSGVLVAGFDLNQHVALTWVGGCRIGLAHLPSPPVTVRFDLLYTSEPLPTYVEYSGFRKTFAEGQAAGGSLLVTSDSTNQMRLFVSPPHDVQVNFQIRYSVLLCGDIVGLDVDGNTFPDEPWLPGVKVNSGYSCKEHWQLNTTNSSPIECKVNSETKVAEWVNNRCTPVQGCRELPPHVANADYSLADADQTATYSCKEGYVTGSTEKAERTSRCTSTDPATVPWTWSSVSFTCAENRCLSPPKNVPYAMYNISDDELTATYRCIEGFSSSTSTRTVYCIIGPDSILPAWTSPSFNCTQDISVAMVAGLCGGIVVFVAVVILGVIVWRRKRSRNALQRVESEYSSGKPVVVGPSYAEELQDLRTNPEGEPAGTKEISPYGVTGSLHSQGLPTNHNGQPPPLPSLPPPSSSTGRYSRRTGTNTDPRYFDIRGHVGGADDGGGFVGAPPRESFYHVLGSSKPEPLVCGDNCPPSMKPGSPAPSACQSFSSFTSRATWKPPVPPVVPSSERGSVTNEGAVTPEVNEDAVLKTTNCALQPMSDAVEPLLRPPRRNKHHNVQTNLPSSRKRHDNVSTRSPASTSSFESQDTALPIMRESRPYEFGTSV